MPTDRKRKSTDTKSTNVDSVTAEKRSRSIKTTSFETKEPEISDLRKQHSKSSKKSETSQSDVSNLRKDDHGTKESNSKAAVIKKGTQKGAPKLDKKGLKAADKEDGKTANKKKSTKIEDENDVADEKANKTSRKKKESKESPAVFSPTHVKKNNPNRLSAKDFDQPCKTLARFLLGKLLVSHVKGGDRVSGRIIETEAYLGVEDKASDSFGGRKTKRNEAMFMTPGMSSIYSVYGMYTCINISSRGDGAAVLIRSLEPVEGLEAMKLARISRMKTVTDVDKLKEHELCNGPAKFMTALGITKELGGNTDLSTCDYLWIENDKDVDDSQVVSCGRVGIERCGAEWANKPLRFYIRDNKCVSKRDKKAEED